MTVIALIIAALAATALAWGARYLYDFVTNDGFGHLAAHDDPPRSHPRDPFESRFA